MADTKVSQLQTLVLPAGEDLLLIIDNPSGTPSSKKISLRSLLANLPSNTAVTGSFSASGNAAIAGALVVSGNTHVTGELVANSASIRIKNRSTVSGNSAVTLFGPGKEGSIAWDQNYLYLATSNTVVKRVALSSFS